MTDAPPLSADALPPRLRQALEASVDAGEHETVDAAIREAVAFWAADREMRLDLMRAQIRRCMEDPRPDLDMEEVFARLEAKSLARMQAAGEVAGEDEAA